MKHPIIITRNGELKNIADDIRAKIWAEYITAQCKRDSDFILNARPPSFLGKGQPGQLIEYKIVYE